MFHSERAIGTVRGTPQPVLSFLATMTSKLTAVLAVAVLAAALPGQAIADPLPKSARAYLAAGESLADARYNLMFGQRKTGTDSLEGSGLINRWGHSLRLFDGPLAGKPGEPFAQALGMHDITYKGGAGEQVTKHLRSGMAHAAGDLYDFTCFNGTAAPADTGAAVRADDAHRSGWHDMKHAVTAMQLRDGRRFVFAEENFYGRVLLYKGF